MGKRYRCYLSQGDSMREVQTVLVVCACVCMMTGFLAVIGLWLLLLAGLLEIVGGKNGN